MVLSAFGKDSICCQPQWPHVIWMCFLKNSILGCTYDIPSCPCCSWLAILNTFLFYVILFKHLENVWRIQFYFIFIPKRHWNYNISPCCPLMLPLWSRYLHSFLFWAAFAFWNTWVFICKLLTLPKGGHSVAWLERDLSAIIY